MLVMETVLVMETCAYNREYTVCELVEFPHPRLWTKTRFVISNTTIMYLISWIVAGELFVLLSATIVWSR